LFKQSQGQLIDKTQKKYIIKQYQRLIDYETKKADLNASTEFHMTSIELAPTKKPAIERLILPTNIRLIIVIEQSYSRSNRMHFSKNISS